MNKKLMDGEDQTMIVSFPPNKSFKVKPETEEDKRLVEHLVRNSEKISLAMDTIDSEELQ